MRSKSPLDPVPQLTTTGVDESMAVAMVAMGGGGGGGGGGGYTSGGLNKRQRDEWELPVISKIEASVCAFVCLWVVGVALCKLRFDMLIYALLSLCPQTAIATQPRPRRLGLPESRVSFHTTSSFPHTPSLSLRHLLRSQDIRLIANPRAQTRLITRKFAPFLSIQRHHFAHPPAV